MKRAVAIQLASCALLIPLVQAPAVRKEPTPRFAIKDITPGDKDGCGMRFWVKDDASGPPGGVLIYPDGAGTKAELFIALAGRPPCSLFGDGVEHLIQGTVRYNADWTLESDLNYPLVFQMDKRLGYVYVSGRGRVIARSGGVRRLGYADTVSSAILALRSTDLRTREGAAWTLGWLAKSGRERASAVTALVRGLADKATTVRRNAAEALGRLQDKQAAQALFAALSDQSPWVADVAREALEGGVASGLNEATVDDLVATLADANVDARLRSFALLGASGHVKAFEPLSARLEGSDATETAGAAWALGRLRDARGTAKLLPLLKHGSAGVREGAAIGLGHQGDGTSVEPLIELLNDQVTTVRKAAVVALAKIGDSSAVAPLSALLTKEPDSGVKDAIRDALRTLQK